MEKDLVEYIAKSLVDDPSGVVVNMIEGEKSFPKKKSINLSASKIEPKEKGIPMIAIYFADRNVTFFRALSEEI